ncbi:hypothetical protein [Pareuzebyella sediminis]|nr:hypothetical protein [Pareuzebyella sediminis]
MTVKHIPTDEVHRGYIGGNTACGIDITKHPSHWILTKEEVTCTKRGCTS